MELDQRVESFDCSGCGEAVWRLRAPGEFGRRDLRGGRMCLGRVIDAVRLPKRGKAGMKLRRDQTCTGAHGRAGGSWETWQQKGGGGREVD